MPLRRTRYLLNRLVAIGVSKNLASQTIEEVSRFVDKSGPEWTVNRLKVIKSGFLRRIAGEPYQLPYIESRMDARGVVPKGPFGALWNLANTELTSVSRVLNALNLYSDFIADHVTPKQWDKFHASATRPLPAAEKLKEVVDSLRVPKWMRVDARVGLETVEEFVVRKGYSPSFVSDALDKFVESDTGMALWEEFPQFNQSFGSLAHSIDARIRFDDYFGYHPSLDSRITEDPIGILGCTQEPGYKLRVFASPNIAYQLVMSRLKKQLFRLLRQVTWDCTYDQSIGTDWVRSQLNQGKRLFSIDLSDATNNFPLEVQLNVLLAIGCAKEDVELFHRLSRAPWLVSHDKSKKVRWTVGQPLGLGPSFAAFALTHGLMVHSIARACHVNDCFRVLGDDIVISEEQVATKYLEAMHNLGVPVSKDKTIVSSTVAEFAGKVVVRDGILTVLKWRQPSDRSFLDVCRLLGPNSAVLLTSRQRRVFDVLSVLPSPEGFGWNPLGVPLIKRLEVLQMYNDITPVKYRTFYPVQRQWARIRLGLKQHYLQLPFQASYSEAWDIPTWKASELSGREPTPVGPWRYQLSISEMTGTPLKLPQEVITPYLIKELSRMGFSSPLPNQDPRGETTLELLEQKITVLLKQLSTGSLVT